MKKMADNNMINVNDLYKLSEKEVIEKIENCKDENISKCFRSWRNAIEVKTSETLPQNRYFVSIEKMKVRYINPLVRNNNKFERIFDISKNAKEYIDETFKFKNSKYIYLDFQITTIDYIGLWEQIHNEDFNLVEFDQIKTEYGKNISVMLPLYC